MYTLSVFYGSQTKPHAVHRIDRSADVLTAIPKLLAEHEGCEHIVVTSDSIRLFSVDCKGNRLP